MSYLTIDIYSFALGCICQFLLMLFLLLKWINKNK